MKSFGFKQHVMGQCIYINLNQSKVVILVLYVNDILLTTNDTSLLYETTVVSQTFKMKDLGEASFVLSIEIHRDRSPVYWV